MQKHTVLVTGANGMLGQDLCPILEDNGFAVVETDVETMDITNISSIRSKIEEINPDIIIHCAAYTNVDKAEEDLKTAELINANGTENIAKICGEKDITLVYISTDYVFDGNGTKPYKPSDKTAPLNNYGLTKWQGEEAVRKYCPKHYIARTSWLYGHHGKNFVETMISLASKSADGVPAELKVVDDQVGCPTWTCELANGIVKLLDKADFGTYHVCGSGYTSWFGFASEIFKLAGLNVNLKPCSTEEFPRPAKRPHYSVMDNNRICREWKAALKDYLALRVD